MKHFKLDHQEMKIKEAISKTALPPFDRKAEILDQATAIPHPRPFRRKRIFLCAAIALMISGTAFAVSNSQLYGLLVGLSPTYIEVTQPVNVACEDQGIRMELLSAGIADNAVVAYLSIQDLTSGRIDQSTRYSYELTEASPGESDAFRSGGISFYSGGSSLQLLNYDESTGVGIYSLEFTTTGSYADTELQLTFDKVFYNERQFHNYPTGLDLTQVSTTPESITFERMEEIRSVWTRRDFTPGFSPDKSPVRLLGDVMDIPIPGVELCKITNIGVVDDYLHVQICRQIDVSASGASIKLLDPDGQYVTPTVDYFNVDENGLPGWKNEIKNGGTTSVPADRAEYIFEIDPSRIGEYELHGWFHEYDMTEGSWTLQVLPEAAQQTVNVQCDIEIGDDHITSVSVSPFGVFVAGTRPNLGTFSSFRTADYEIKVVLADGGSIEVPVMGSSQNNDDLHVIASGGEVIPVEQVTAVLINGQIVQLD